MKLQLRMMKRSEPFIGIHLAFPIILLASFRLSTPHKSSNRTQHPIPTCTIYNDLNYDSIAFSAHLFFNVTISLCSYNMQLCLDCQ